MRIIIIFITIITFTLAISVANVNQKSLTPYIGTKVCKSALSSLINSPSTLVINNIQTLNSELILQDAITWIKSNYSSESLVKPLIDMANEDYKNNNKMIKTFVSIDYSAEERLGISRTNFLCSFHLDLFGKAHLSSLTYKNKDYTDFTKIFLLRKRPDWLDSTWHINEAGTIDKIYYIIENLTSGMK